MHILLNEKRGGRSSNTWPARSRLRPYFCANAQMLRSPPIEAGAKIRRTTQDLGADMSVPRNVVSPMGMHARDIRVSFGANSCEFTKFSSSLAVRG